MIQTFLLRAQSWALMALAVVLALLGAYAVGSRHARKSEQKKSEADRLRKDIAVEKGNSAAKDTALEAAMARRDAEVAAATLAPGEAQRKLQNEWARD